MDRRDAALFAEKMGGAQAPRCAGVRILILLLLLLLLLLLARPVWRSAPEAFRDPSPLAARTTTVIGIEGVACAGKSTLARNLQERLEARGYRVKVIHQDDSPGSLVGMNRSNAAPLCKMFISNVRAIVASQKYDIVVVEGCNCAGRCGETQQSAAALMHRLVRLRYTGNCRKDGRRPWQVLKPFHIAIRDAPDHASVTTYTVDNVEPGNLADAVLRKVLQTHLHRTGESVDT